MIIEINKAEKVQLLKALQLGFIDTDKIPALKTELDKAKPARILTKEESKEYKDQIENEWRKSDFPTIESAEISNIERIKKRLNYCKRSYSNYYTIGI